MAMYTPAGSTCTNDNALPRLKRPSELPNAYGIIAPVRTIVLPDAGGSAAASAAAVSTIVSVPCVMSTREHEDHVVEDLLHRRRIVGRQMMHQGAEPQPRRADHGDRG